MGIHSWIMYQICDTSTNDVFNQHGNFTISLGIQGHGSAGETKQRNKETKQRGVLTCMEISRANTISLAHVETPVLQSCPGHEVCRLWVFFQAIGT